MCNDRKNGCGAIEGYCSGSGGSTVISDLTIPVRSVANVIVILEGSVGWCDMSDGYYFCILVRKLRSVLKTPHNPQINLDKGALK